MKILLVQPLNRSYVIMPSLGLGYLAAVLRGAGHEVAIFNCLLERLPPREFAHHMMRFAPDVIGFQVFSYDLTVVRDYLRSARDSRPGATLIAGGPHPSGDPEGTLEFLADLDYAFRGEAETGLPLLLRTLAGEDLALNDIPGLVYREGREIRVNPPALVSDLDALPFPAWDLLEPERYPEAPHGAFSRTFPTAPVITSRGCPCACTFCAGMTVHGRQLRTRSLGLIMEELAVLRRRGIREFHVEDENFTLNKERVLRFCRLLEQQGLGMSWSLPSGVRIDTLDAEMIDAMENAGCYSLALGIEFGSDRMHALTRKGITAATIESQLGLFRRRSIKTTGFFLFGTPGETKQEMEKTLDLALRLPLGRAQFNNFMPLPGSAIWEELKKRGELSTVPWDRFFVHDVPYAGKGITPAYLKRLQRRAYLRFYLRPRILLKLVSEIRSWRHFSYLLRRLIDSLN